MTKRILVVDDDAVVRASCERVLAAEGHHVVAVTSAERAISIIESGGVFDLVIVDIKMPLRDGYSLMQEIGARWPTLPIVVTSGYPTDETIIKSRELGASGFLAKPFSPIEMLDVICRMTKKEEER